MTTPEQAHRGSVVPTVRPSSKLADIDVSELVDELLSKCEGEEITAPRTLKQMSRLVATLTLLLVDKPQNRYKSSTAANVVREVVSHPDASWWYLAGKSFLDLGCGSVNPYGPSAMMLALGARDALAVDIEEVVDHGVAVRTIYSHICDLVTGVELAGQPLSAVEILDNIPDMNLRQCATGDCSGIPADRLRVAQANAMKLPAVSGSVDLVSSRSFLEHVDDIHAVLTDLRRVSSDSAIGVHYVDGFDHRWWVDRTIHPLEFLTLGEDDSSEGMYFGCNRVRPTEMVSVFEDCGFEVCKFVPNKAQTVEIDSGFVERLQPKFRHMELDDLRIGGATLFTRIR